MPCHVYLLAKEVISLAQEVREYRATSVLLIVMAIITLVYYGAHLFFPVQMLQLFDLEVPPLLLYVRILGGFGIAFGVGLWMASRDPVKNAALITTAVIATGLMALLILGYLLRGRLPATEWLDVVLLAAFTILLPVFFLARK